MKRLNLLLSVAGVLFFTAPSLAQEAPRVGREAAAKYFQKRQVADDSAVMGSSDHYLALHIGTYTSSQAYEWGQHGKEENVGSTDIGVTYRVGEWEHSMDMNVRVEFEQYKVAGQSPNKLSFLPLITFPDASSRFPLYFGAGAGLGVFMNQVKEESSLSLDYQLVAGARFFNVFENTGFFLETGLKNHLLITSTGQLNGVFVAAGAVFTF